MRLGTKSLALLAVAALATTAIQFGSVFPGLAHGLTSHHHMPVKPPPVQTPNIVNVKDYGATGDGVTDDAPYIQNAINAATASGFALFFPAGTYLHAEPLTFNGIAVTGVGPTSILLAANTGAVVNLTGYGPSIQNMQISTQGLIGSGINIYVSNATSFTVSNNTITQGNKYFGVSVYFSSVGAINSNTFNGDGSPTDTGAQLNSVSNCSVNSNLFQNEAVAISAANYNQFIAVQNNVIGNITYPTQSLGVQVLYGCNAVTISGNTIQMANSNDNSSYPIFLQYPSNVDIIQNQTWGGWNAILVELPQLPGGYFIEQNTIHNCGSSGIWIDASRSTNLVPTLLNNNVFGECGLFDTSLTSAVISVFLSPTAPLVTSSQIMNNSYQGHANNLQFYVEAPKFSPSNISGNMQSQTALPGNPNN
jgi:hypothetical protein